MVIINKACKELRIYQFYEKAHKKCGKLNKIVDALKCCLEPQNLPVEGGNKPF